MYKAAWDIILLHMCTKNEDHMMYASWDIRWDSQSFLSFWVIFIPLTLPITQNIQILKKWKKAWRYHNFPLVYLKWQSNVLWFLRYKAWQKNFYVILGYFSPFYSTNNTENYFWKNEKKNKKTKNAGRYYHFTLVYHNWQSYDVCFLRYGMWQA